eukprot:6957570-Prymnesium_polylepis.2
MQPTLPFACRPGGKNKGDAKGDAKGKGDSKGKGGGKGKGKGGGGDGGKGGKGGPPPHMLKYEAAKAARLGMVGGGSASGGPVYEQRAWKSPV